MSGAWQATAALSPPRPQCPQIAAGGLEDARGGIGWRKDPPAPGLARGPGTGRQLDGRMQRRRPLMMQAAAFPAARLMGP